MPDRLTVEQRSRNMARIKAQGNRSTELAFIRLCKGHHIRGWRRSPSLPGKPDFVFLRQRVVVFVDGCFWHGCPRCYVPPASHKQFWREKLLRNRRRDRKINRLLRRTGWKVMRIWEHLLENSKLHPRVTRQLLRVLRIPVATDRAKLHVHQ